MADTDASQVPLDIIISTMKTNIAQYANNLAQHYHVPGIFVIFILNEIVTDSKLNSLQDSCREMMVLLEKKNNESIQGDTVKPPSSN